jgi:WD40 repeat protein
MIQHKGPISGVACSKRYIATAGYDNQVILWDARSKTALARGFHDHLANRCEISKDEKFLLTASSDYTSRLWRLPEMKLVSVYGEHRDDVETARLSPCGKMVATTSTNGQVRVFSIEGQLLVQFEGHKGIASQCLWSEDGRVLSVGDDGKIRCWNIREAKMDYEILLEDVQTDAIAVSRAGTIFAGNDSGEIVKIENGKKTSLRVHAAGIKNISLSPDESRLVSLSYDRRLVVSKVDGELEIEKTIELPHMVWARACAFKDNDRLIFGTFGSSYAGLDLTSGEWDFSQIRDTPCLNALQVENGIAHTVGDAGDVRAVRLNSTESAFTPTEVIGRTGSLCNFITRFDDQYLCGGHLGRVFNAHTGESLLQLRAPINKGLQAGPYLILATYVGELAVCRWAGGTLELVGEFKVLSNAVKDLCVSGDLVFCAGAAADIAIFDWRKLERVGYRPAAHAMIVNSCAAIGAGRFVTVSRDLHLKVWHGTELAASYRSPHDHSIKCATADEAGRFVATGSYDGKIAIFDLHNAEWRVFQKISAAGISSLTFGDGNFWATSYDGVVHRIGRPCDF